MLMLMVFTAMSTTLSTVFPCRDLLATLRPGRGRAGAGGRGAEVPRGPAREPLPARAGEMQTHAHTRMTLERIEKRQVALAIGAIEHLVEIPDRLMGMKQ